MFINRGVKGQTKEIIKKDIEIAKRYFKHITLNLYVNNTTAIKADEELKSLSVILTLVLVAKIQRLL